MNRFNEFPLTGQEKKLKEIYDSGGKKLLETPMTFEQYSQFMDLNPGLPDMRGYYRETTAEGYGTTLEKKGIFACRDDVDISLHERYAYPILHNHAFFEIVYVCSGSCINYVEHSAVKMEKGDICFMAPDTMHTVVAVDDEDVIMNLIVSKNVFEDYFLGMHGEKNLISDFFTRVLYHKAVDPYILFQTGEDARIRRLWMEMYREKQERKYAYEECLILETRLLFIRLIRHYEVLAIVPGYKNKESDPHIVAMLGYISANYNRVTLGSLARFFCYSEAYVSRMLRQHTGKTFLDIVNDLKLENAKKMLETTDWNISRISQETGYFDSSHLNKKFRARYGVSPGVYRKKFLAEKKQQGISLKH